MDVSLHFMAVVFLENLINFQATLTESWRDGRFLYLNEIISISYDMQNTYTEGVPLLIENQNDKKNMGITNIIFAFL